VPPATRTNARRPARAQDCALTSVSRGAPRDHHTYERFDTTSPTVSRPSRSTVRRAQRDERHMRRELTRCFDGLATDDAVKVIVRHTGPRRAFSAGADIREFVAPLVPCSSARRAAAWTSPGHGSLRAADPGRHQRFALGAASSWRWRATSHRRPPARDGSHRDQPRHHPGGGGTQRLPRLVGRGKALEMILTGARLPADEALRIGLVERVVPTGEALKAATELAHAIAAKRGGAALCEGAVVKGLSCRSPTACGSKAICPRCCAPPRTAWRAPRRSSKCARRSGRGSNTHVVRPARRAGLGTRPRRAYNPRCRSRITRADARPAGVYRQSDAITEIRLPQRAPRAVESGGVGALPRIARPHRRDASGDRRLIDGSARRPCASRCCGAAACAWRAARAYTAERGPPPRSALDAHASRPWWPSPYLRTLLHRGPATTRLHGAAAGQSYLGDRITLAIDGLLGARQPRVIREGISEL